MDKTIYKITNGEAYLDEIKELIIEYTQTLSRDLSFQNLDNELSALKAKYTPPNGRILAAVMDGSVIGCVAFRKHSDYRCEMKRLYLKPKYRGLKLGEALVRAIVEAARTEGYTEMVLDTIKPLQSAVRLYKKLGFEETDAYYENPMHDVIYMRLCL